MPTTSVYSAVQQVGGTDAPTILSTLLATTQQTSQMMWTYQMVATDSRFSQAFADAISLALLANNGQAAVVQYVTNGINLSLPQSQSGLDAIAAASPSIAADCAVLKSLGVWQQAAWQSMGLSQAPVLSDVETALSQIANQQTKTMFANATLNALMSDETKTPSDIKTAVAAWNP